MIVVTDSVHGIAAVADHLSGMPAPPDEITVLGIGDERDAMDALNVATVRLGPLATVRTERIDAADPVAAIDEQVTAAGAETIVVAVANTEGLAGESAADPPAIDDRLESRTDAEITRLTDFAPE